jgi:hypothetical protein
VKAFSSQDTGILYISSIFEELGNTIYWGFLSLFFDFRRRKTSKGQKFFDFRRRVLRFSKLGFERNTGNTNFKEGYGKLLF